jgi:hypothetical protein
MFVFVLRELILTRHSLVIRKHRNPLDFVLLIVGLILVFFNHPIAPYLQTTPEIVTLLGEIFLAFGLIIFIYGRVRLSINA